MYYCNMIQLMLLMVAIIMNGILSENILNTDCQLISTELNVLQDFYISTNGNNWIWQPLSNGIEWNFNNNSDPCKDNWQGITCTIISTQLCSVSEIQLKYYNLEGNYYYYLILFYFFS